MLTRRVIVCLDVKGGRVVKGTQFVNLRDVGDPVELAARYEAEGADEVCFLDISASAEERGTLLDLARRTAERLFVPLTIGGGVRTVDDVGRVLRAGADKVSLNTSAVQTPEVIERAAYRFGAQCVVVSIDAKRREPVHSELRGPMNAERGEASVDRRGEGGARHERDGSPAGGPPPDFIIPREGAATATSSFPAASDPSASSSPWEVYTHGGRTPTGLDAVAWARECVRRGAGEILLTSIDRDGARIGYDLELTRAIASAVDVPVIASGGAGNAAHVRDAIVQAGADAALVAGILHDGQTTVGEIKRVMADAGIPVRGATAAAGTP